jgi:uncharacterized protein YggT (Ycf19 family)
MQQPEPGRDDPERRDDLTEERAPLGPGAPVEGEGPVEEQDRVAPATREVERRSGEDRRVRDVAVEEDRRLQERRASDLARRERRRAVVQRVTLAVDYLFYVLYGLLGIRFVLTLLGAAETAGFVVFINGLTNPFYAPFEGIVARPSINGGALDFPLLIALLAYILLHIAVRGLLRLLAGDRATV